MIKLAASDHFGKIFAKIALQELTELRLTTLVMISENYSLTKEVSHLILTGQKMLTDLSLILSCLSSYCSMGAREGDKWHPSNAIVHR